MTNLDVSYWDHMTREELLASLALYSETIHTLTNKLQTLQIKMLYPADK